MSTEAPVILLISSPQNSKTPQLREIDLLNDFAYGRTANAFGRALGVLPAESLNYNRQCASVVHSVASFGAFATGLREVLYPGSVYPAVDFKFMGHSVGEMAAFVGAGILDIPTASAILTQRQFITEHTLGAGIKCMFAAVGLDISRYEIFLDKIKEQFQGKVEAVVANFNSPSEGVLSVQVAEDAEEKDGKSLAAKLTSSLGEFKHASAEHFKVICLPISNAFHSAFMGAEEEMLIKSEEPFVRSRIRRVTPGMIYSPMMPGWVETEEQAIGIILHQLTRPVNFVQAMKDILQIPNLVAIVTADVKDIMPKMVQNNLTDQTAVSLFNIKDKRTLLEAIDGCRKLCAA